MSFFSKIYGSWKGVQEEKYTKILGLVRKLHVDITKGTVLDIGCGPFYFERFLEKQGIGTSNFICIDVEKQQPGGRFGFLLADGSRLPLKKGCASAALCIDSLHMIEDLSDTGRALRKGGMLVISSFFSEANAEDVELASARKLNGFKILNKTILKGRENELVMLCVKE